jgi:hypothetical protein
MESKLKEPKVPRTTLSGTKSSHNYHTNDTQHNAQSKKAVCAPGSTGHPEAFASNSAQERYTALTFPRQLEGRSSNAFGVRF